MTDAMSSLIIQNAILPEFRRGDFSAGIRAGVRDIKDVLLGDAEEVKERAQAGAGADALDFWSIVLIVFWICVVLFVLFAVVQSDQQRTASRGPAVGAAAAPITIPGGSGGWGGGWSGGDSGGGGWSGGGGDFGGGGSSGSW